LCQSHQSPAPNPSPFPLNGFLPASDSKHLEKKPGRRKKMWIGLGLVLAAGSLALLTGLLVWHFHLRSNVKVRRVYIGSMGISHQRFLSAHEDPNSPEFTNLASLVSMKVLNFLSLYLHKPYSLKVDATGSTSILPIYQHAAFSEKSSASDSESWFSKDSSFIARLLFFSVKSFTIHVNKAGTFDSPGFPDSTYPPNVYLQWRLRADPRHRVQLDFHTLILEDDCQQDFIKIYDSLVPIEHRALTEQCGYPHKSLTFLSSGNVMLLTLVTSEEKEFPGFRVNYAQIPLTEQECGGTLTENKGTLSTPFFPSNYPPKTSCVWNIEVPQENFVKVQFNRFFIGNESADCPNDYVEVNNERLCGRNLKSTVIIRQSNKMTINFKSDLSYVDQGFSAEYEAFIPTNPCPGRFQCTNNLCINKTLQCDGWNDCGDSSDEDNCTCNASQMKCRNGRCKPKFWRCNGLDDCGDNTDEENCTKCEPGKFSCRNGRCISGKLECNGKDECGDGSDESKCEKSLVLNQCSEFTFHCKNGHCISKLNPECDGEEDCDDGSDEADCSTSRRTGALVSWAVRSRERTTSRSQTQSGTYSWIPSSALTSDLCLCRYSQADQWEALLGLHIQSQTNEWTVRKNIKRIIAHPDYNDYTFNNDIALMELDGEITLNQYIWPICLPSPTYDVPAGQEAWITGWGATREGGMAATVLQKAEVRIINSTVCNGLMSEDITDGMLCAGILQGGVDACQGDSGGPLSITSASGQAFLAGVVSWGDGCGLRNKPGIYTRVTKYRNWIKENCGV
uniref:Suppressor of tumorigenicity 14 protein homolog n=1 Tax=Echeneis naucrates TaxID=173247 RepID=A0A665VJL6_ECHNA